MSQANFSSGSAAESSLLESADQTVPPTGPPPPPSVSHPPSFLERERISKPAGSDEGNQRSSLPPQTDVAATQVNQTAAPTSIGKNTGPQLPPIQHGNGLRHSGARDHRAVPPPPPPRATLPPVRRAVPPEYPAGEPNTSTGGVGSARVGRWQGEVAPIRKAQPPQGTVPKTPSTTGGDPNLSDQPSTANDPSDLPADRVTRTAPPWLVSMVIHLVLLLLLALVTTPAGKKLGRIVLTIGEAAPKEAPELAEFSIASDDSLIDTKIDAEDVSEVDLPPIFEAVEVEAMKIDIPVPEGIGEAMLAEVRPMFGGRTGATKEALLKLYGGTPETQEAVAMGLQWLKRNQGRKGGWSMRGPYRDGAFSENECAATAMALLAFLGDGHTHKSGQYAAEVEKGLKYLLKMQDRSGFFAAKSQGHEQMYAQAQATIAVCEMYGMTKDSWLRPYAQAAIVFAEKSQSRQGGWRYQPRIDADTSVTGWFLMALESGRSAGLDVNDSVMRHIGDYLDTVASYEGAAYAYQPRRPPTSPMTAEGLLCRQYLGWQRTDIPLIRGIEALLIEDPFDISQRDVYYWYYATQVMHHFGGSPWRTWNDAMREQLPAAQVKTGREKGSWAPQLDQYGGTHGRIYTTCLSIYCLEVYYRHMPIYQADGKQIK